jgi:hypothetical protein
LSLDRLEHKQRLKALFGAIEQLQTLNKDLFDVGCCLETLVTWWSNIKAQLEQITSNLEHHGVSFYRNDDIMNSVRNSWIHIKKEYSAYRDEVIRFSTRLVVGLTNIFFKVSAVQDCYMDDTETLGKMDVRIHFCSRIL